MPGNFVNVIAEASDIKQECEEDDLLEIVDNLKEETIEESVQFNCHKSENFVSVSLEHPGSSITNIKTEIE